MQNTLFALLLFASWIAAERYRGGRRRDRKTLAWSLIFAAPAVYLAVLYAARLSGPDFGDVLEWVYGPPSDWLVCRFGTKG